MFKYLLIVNDTNYFLPLRYEDWWWKVALGKCYFRLGMLRWPGVQVARCLDDQALLLVFILREVLNCKMWSSIAAFLPESFWGNAQGCGEAVQVGHKTAANDRHLSNAGQGVQNVLIYWLLLRFVKVYLRLDQPLAALEVRWDCGIPFLSFHFLFCPICLPWTSHLSSGV